MEEKQLLLLTDLAVIAIFGHLHESLPFLHTSKKQMRGQAGSHRSVSRELGLDWVQR